MPADTQDDPVRTDLTPDPDAAPRTGGDDAPTAEEIHGWVDRYFESTRGGDVEPWLANFADGAVVDDPVGTPVKSDPDAIRAMGEGFLGGLAEVGLFPSFVHATGREAVARWEGRGRTQDGAEVRFDGINVFRFDGDGRIVELRGFYAPPDG